MADSRKLAKDVMEVLTTLHRDMAEHLIGGGAWTRAVKTELCSLGKKKYEYTVCASGIDDKECKPDYGEWLFDVCWLRYSGEKKGCLLSDVALVAESEWGNVQDVIDDFQKLMLARADLRVMIFDGEKTNTESMQKKIAKEIKSFAATNGGKGEATDCYLLAAWKSDEPGFKFFELDGNGEPLKH